MKIRRNHFCLRQLLSAGLLMMALVHPVPIVSASAVSRAETLTASAVIVPARVARLGFLISGMAREVPVREGDRVGAGQPLIVLDMPELEFAVVEAQAALRAAQSYAELQKYGRVKNRRNGKIFYDELPAVYRQRADARVQQAQTAVELAQIHLGEGTLAAPFDGAVASLAVIPGEFVEADQVVVTLATLNELQLETTDLSERDITRVRIGAPVNIFIEALQQTFPGKVITVAQKADVVGGDVVFKVTVAFDEQPENLLWGMTAEVTINE